MFVFMKGRDEKFSMLSNIGRNFWGVKLVMFYFRLFWVGGDNYLGYGK